MLHASIWLSATNSDSSILILGLNIMFWEWKVLFLIELKRSKYFIVLCIFHSYSKHFEKNEEFIFSNPLKFDGMTITIKNFLTNILNETIFKMFENENTQRNENIKRLFQTTTIQMKCGEKRMNTDDELSAKWWSEMWLIRRR